MPFNEFVAAIRVHGFNQFAHVASRQQIDISLHKVETFTSLFATAAQVGGENYLMIGSIGGVFTLGVAAYIYKSMKKGPKKTSETLI